MYVTGAGGGVRRGVARRGVGGVAGGAARGRHAAPPGRAARRRAPRAHAARQPRLPQEQVRARTDVDLLDTISD